MLIQWYPGHMAKARRMLIENLKLIDVVVELVDARAPRATRNPDFDDLFSAKRRGDVYKRQGGRYPKRGEIHVYQPHCRRFPCAGW